MEAMSMEGKKPVAMLSQPMAGKTEEEITETRDRAVKWLTERGFQVLNTRFTDDWYNPEAMAERGVKNIPLEFMATSLSHMSHCDAVYFCKGWEDARGCRIEHAAAEAYGVQILYELSDKAAIRTHTFEEALAAIKAGRAARRLGWNGQTQCVTLATSVCYREKDTDLIKAENEATGGKALVFHGTQGDQVGWLASQADMLAEDWIIIGEK